MAIDAGVWIPSGDPTQFTGESHTRYMGRAIFSGDTSRVFYALNLGYYERSHQVISDAFEVGPSMIFGLATGFDKIKIIWIQRSLDILCFLRKEVILKYLMGNQVRLKEC